MQTQQMGLQAEGEAEAVAAQQWIAALVDAQMECAEAGAYGGWRPLHAAVVGGSRECVELLLAEGGAFAS